jgi:hypothetical protein
MNLRRAVGAASLLLFVGCVKHTAVVAPTDVVVGGVKGPALDVSIGPDSSSNRAKWEARDEVEVEWRGKWYPAVVLNPKGENRYLVHYDGYGEEWDEVVTSLRIRLRHAEEPEEPADPTDTELDP